MFFRDLKPKDDVTLRVTLAEIHLPVRLGHRDAEKIFVAPLSEQLAATGLGAITDFDARAGEDSDIVGLDIYLGLTDSSRSALRTVARMLDYLRAPYGSSIRLSDAPGDPLVFGTTEGLVVSVATDAAPDAAARKELATACRSAVDDDTVSRGWSRREDRTLFYFYGESFRDMKDRLVDALDSDPRFSGAVLRRLA